MLERIRKLIKNKEALLDFFCLFAGVLMFVAMLAYGAAQSEYSMYLVIVFGGLLNLLHGWKLYGQKARRNTGMSMMLLGAVILLLCLTIMLR